MAKVKEAAVKYRDRIRLSQEEIEESNLEIQEDLSINGIDKFLNFLEGKFITNKDEMNTVLAKVKENTRELEKLKSGKPLDMQKIVDVWKAEDALEFQRKDVENKKEALEKLKTKALALKAELF